MVVTKKGGGLLADLMIHARPSVNDLATLLANAMRRPQDGEARRPRLVRLRGHHQWRDLFPHLEEIGVGVEVLVGRSLPGIETAYGEHLRRLREARRVGMIRPTTEQARIDTLFPAVSRWVEDYGWIEIGVQELFGFVARALHEGGTQVEDERTDPLAEAMAALEKGLARWFVEQVEKKQLSGLSGLHLRKDRPSPRTSKTFNLSSSETDRNGAVPAHAPSLKSTRESEEVCQCAPIRMKTAALFEIMSKRRRGYPERDPRQAGPPGRPRRQGTPRKARPQRPVPVR
jgi:hypothetical protein